MFARKITKQILSKSLFNSRDGKSVYSTTSFQKVTSFRQKKPQRQLKAYEKLFYSSPLMNINIEMIMAINELRPKATYIIATKNGQHPKQICNSTFNIVQCLNYIQGFKYFYKSFPALAENITRVLSQKIDFTQTGIYKPNTIKRFVLMLSHIDCLHGQIFVQLTCVYFIWALQNSIKNKTKLLEALNPLKDRLKQIQEKRKSLTEQTKLPSQQIQSVNSALNEETLQIETQMKKLIYENRFMKQQDFLCGLHYCLQRGYYSEITLRYFIEELMQKGDSNILQFDHFFQDQKQFFYEGPLSNIQNKRAVIYCRMYSNAVYRIKILNQLKKIKQFDYSFMDFIKKTKADTPEEDTSESTTEQSPFLNGPKVDVSSSSEQTSQEKVQYMTDKLIEESIISRKSYLKLVSKYVELLQKKDVLCYILAEQSTSQSLRIFQTQFFQYLSQSQTKNDHQNLTLSAIKTRYLNIFKQIFNVQKNGLGYAQSPIIQGVFQAVLRMYDYTDRKQIFQLLTIYERYLLSKNIFQIKSLAPFYVFEKYHYKSNFVASKLFQYINSKYRLGRQQHTIKQQLILFGNQICKYFCLYFKLLEQNISSLFSTYELSAKAPKSQFIQNTAQSNQNKKPQNQQQINLNIKYQQEFQQAVEIFLHNYNKMISVVYLERQNSGFIGKGLQLSFEYLRVKYFSTKFYEHNLLVGGKVPEEDIRKIITENSQVIKAHRSYVKNVYEKQFMNNTKSNSEALQNSVSLTFNPYVQCIFSKRNSVLNPLDQLSVILDIMQTAIQLQTLKKVQYYEDVLVIFKSIFENKKLVKILTSHQTFPQILKRLIQITQLFKGSYKNESNKLFESIINLTDFNLNNFLHSARINIARQILNTEKNVIVNEKFQPNLYCLDLNLRYDRNVRICSDPSYTINKQNVISNIRSDILYTALMQNSQLQKIIRDELAKIKTIRPSQKIKNMKFQLNYLQYPYLANVAINKNNQLIVILVRKSTQQRQKPYNKVLNSYYDQSQAYFRRKGNKVMVAMNQAQIRNSLRELIK